MKKVIVLICTIIVMGLIIPIKFAKVEKDTNGNNNIIAHPNVAGEDPMWVIISNENKTKYINIKGNIPSKMLNHKLINDGINKFVLIGEYDKKNNELFIVKNWEIIGPINRERTANFFTPKEYLCILDFIK